MPHRHDHSHDDEAAPEGETPDYLGGAPIVPQPLVPDMSVADLIDTAFQAYNAGDMARFDIRTLDQIGMPIEAGPPSVISTGLRPRVNVFAAQNDIPGSYVLNVRVGGPDSNGLNVITLTSGSVSKKLYLSVQSGLPMP